MKRTSFLLLIIISCIVSIAQNKAKPVPFIIEGKLENYPLKQVYLIFKEGRKYVIDTTEVLANGSFYLKSFKVRKPVNAFLLGQNYLFPNLYVAPGYHLTVAGDAKNFAATRTLAGTGSETNRFIILRDSLFNTRGRLAWNEMNEAQLLSFIKTDQHLRDSLYKTVFEKRPRADKWFAYFARMTWLDNRFEKLYFLVNYAIDDNTFTYQKTVSFIEENFDRSILADLYKDEYMMSDEYRMLMSDYPIYLGKVKCRKDSAQCATMKDYNVRFSGIIADNYKGSIKQIKLFERMNNALRNCRSFEELNFYKANFPRYIKMLQSKEDRDEIDSALVKNETVLLKTQIGTAAPLFTAIDSSGASYSIASFNGKVVYLDLWASWCVPCREQTPYLKTIVEKYKNDSSIVFISVAVLDKADKWKAAVIKDKPGWLQLFDSNNTVQSSYVANSIPKFILIDKKGNIVNFDSPPPSSGPELEQLLNNEITK